MLRFQAFENKFATTKKKLVVHSIKLKNQNHPVSIVPTSVSSETISQSKDANELVISDVSSQGK